MKLWRKLWTFSATGGNVSTAPRDGLMYCVSEIIIGNNLCLQMFVYGFIRSFSVRGKKSLPVSVFRNYFNNALLI